ncbi:hypothetical protein [Shewanella psychromarinicola]|nr:hypothetical protein [Shewanella psychromarinicola]
MDTFIFVTYFSNVEAKILPAPAPAHTQRVHGLPNSQQKAPQ